ncbi:uncharacterized protein LOC121304695 isoform X2 [Polyodon spathula]|uniref:uncharacterized protein LOC121304695 isoform X2 n=1 Tax=Polyodon spathula TaxID=7913 RepID=UPI001B7F091C|nr:uncharacterized protein LOC121304695 isoform X2 [Polyodon spathula]
MRAGGTVFGALLLLWGPVSLTQVSVCEGSPEGGFTPELVEVHNRSVLRCINSCSQKNLSCYLVEGCQRPQAGEWTSSPYKLAVSIIYLEDRKGPGLQINFSLAPDANLLHVNRTVIEISMADRRHCATLQYTGSFTAQWSFSYIACMTVKPGQSLSVSLYNMPYGYQPLTRSLQLPDCENPLMKEYAGELCPAILIHSRLSRGVLNVTYSSSLADPSYLVSLCVWNAHFCSSEDASTLAAPVKVAGQENSVIFHNITALPCLCIWVISKMPGLHHEGQDCPFRARFHLDVKVQPGPHSLLLQLSGFPRPCSLLLQTLLLHTDRGSGLLLNLTQPQDILVSGPHSQEFPLPPSLQYSWPVCIKVWAENIYKVPARIHCTSPVVAGRTGSRWLGVLPLFLVLVTVAACLLLHWKYKRKSSLFWELQRENMQLQQRVHSVRVLLLCSWDHPFFQAVVESLALFLHEECHCHVALDMWDRRGIAKLGPKAWLSEQLAVADRVVLVWSRGASLKWEAWSSGLEGEPGLVEPEFGDLFTPGLLHSVDSYLRSGEGRVCAVCFDSDSSRSGIPCCFRDEHVHSLMSGTRKFVKKLSHIKVDFRRTESGQKLQSKLKEFREYQRHSPTWFEDWHHGLQGAGLPKTTEDPSKVRRDAALLHGSESEATALEDASCSSSTGQAEEEEIAEIVKIAEIVETGLPSGQIENPLLQSRLSVSSGHGSLSLPESRLLPPKPEPFQDKELGAQVAC